MYILEFDISYFSSTEPNDSTPGIVEVSAGMQLAYSSQPAETAIHLNWWEWRPADEIVKQTGVEDGGVVIFDTQQSVALLVIEPGGVNRQNIAEKLQMLYGVELGEDGGYVNADGTPWGFGDGQANDHKCLFKQLPILGNSLDFLCELEKFLWLGLSIFSSLKAAEVKTPEGRTGWFALGAFSGYKALDSFKP